VENLLRDRLKEFSEIEKDLQRIAIRRFFAVMEETRGLSRRGNLVMNILKIYRFGKEDLIEFMKVFEGLKDVNWIRRELVGDKEQEKRI